MYYVHLSIGPDVASPARHVSAQALCCPLLRHSPSFCAQSKSCGKMLYLDGWQHLGERVGNHVISGAINEVQGALLNDPLDPVIVHVDVLGPGVVLVVAHECDG